MHSSSFRILEYYCSILSRVLIQAKSLIGPEGPARDPRANNIHFKRSLIIHVCSSLFKGTYPPSAGSLLKPAILQQQHSPCQHDRPSIAPGQPAASIAYLPDQKVF